MKVAAYVYPGWHSCAERDAHHPPGWTEWDLVYDCRPRFPGHAQPRLPLWGRYDDSDPAALGPRICAASDHGVDLFVYGFFWCRGKRVFQEGLDAGFLGSGPETPFAVMWANRMPRHVLPVKRRDLPVLESGRLVGSDIEDFLALVRYVARRYFQRLSYHRIDGVPYFSIYDSTFFLRELGLAKAAQAIARAREWLAKEGFGGFHLAAVDPAPGFIEQVREVGFDSVTNYVLLPLWKGSFHQDYQSTAAQRAGEWPEKLKAAGLPYHPSVSPGWDASPRGADFGREKPRKYPWWPVVTGEAPDRFQEALERALLFGRRHGGEDDLVFIASLNEWSEGHYLEPDERFGMGWLRAVRAAREKRG